jgi:hypothetical protein
LAERAGREPSEESVLAAEDALDTAVPYLVELIVAAFRPLSTPGLRTLRER